MAVAPHLPNPHRIAGQLLFGTAIFLAAFLIFLVQPMVGKRILPWFGGTPAVWTLCLAVYQTTLFLGYAYAHLLIRFASPLLQLVIHGVLFGAALMFLPVLPGDAWQPSGVENPGSDILAILIANVVLPFLVLASTGPLVQAWFVRWHPGVSPYPLYALSNVGSLAALLSYPFVLEPRLPLSETGTLWSFAFASSAVAVLSCAALALRAGAREFEPIESDTNGGSDHLAPPRVALWFLLPGCAVVALMGVTNKLCLDVASVPFLWILPLATYLVTFILCFGSERVYRRVPFVALTMITVGFTLARRSWFPSLPTPIRDLFASAPGEIVSYCLLLFGVGMVMHGEIYRLRPPPRALTAFYLCVSAGGALGGLFVGIAAPSLFTAYYELPFGLALAWLLLLFVCSQDPSSVLSTSAPRWRWGAIGSLTLASFVYAGWTHVVTPDSILHQERNFFGVLRVVENAKDTRNHIFKLYHGTTLHGVQLQSGRGRTLPTSYFGRATAIGLLMSLRREDAEYRIGIIGLGTGTLAAYGRRGDLFRFYEIDPAVVRVSSGDDGYFDFLSRSPATIEVVVGDARLSLARERARGVEHDFDILVLDAFSGDAIPIHLLTREVFSQYADALTADGLLAVHVSNRYFDLMSLVARQGMAAGMDSLRIKTIDAPRFRSRTSKWVFLSRDPARLARLKSSLLRKHESMGLDPTHIRVDRSEPGLARNIRVWTDDFSDLFSVLKPQGFDLLR